jgi:hypothetical protein
MVALGFTLLLACGDVVCGGSGLARFAFRPHSRRCPSMLPILALSACPRAFCRCQLASMLAA